MAEGNDNGKKMAYSVGAVVLALGTLFAVLNGIPWETKSQANEQQQTVSGQIARSEERHRRRQERPAAGHDGLAQRD